MPFVLVSSALLSWGVMRRNQKSRRRLALVGAVLFALAIVTLFMQFVSR